MPRSSLAADCAILLCTAVTFSAQPALAAAATIDRIEISEHLGKPWMRELVERPTSLDPACPKAALRVSGPRGPLAAQLRASEGGTRVAFVIDLERLASDSYVARCDPSDPAPAPASDLAVRESEDLVELSTGPFGAKLLLGSRRYPKPVSSAQVPGPIRALRMQGLTRVGEGWIGGSRLTGPGRIRAYTARVVEDGPVVASVEARYVYEDGTILTLRFELAAGDSALRIDTDVTRDRRGDAWEILLGDEHSHFTHRVQIEAGSRRAVAIEGNAEAGDWIDVALDREPAGEVTRLTPWHDWWNDRSQTQIRLQRRSGSHELRITRRDAGAWVTPSARGTLSTTGELNQKVVPLLLDDLGALWLRVDNARGIRRFAIGTRPRGSEEDGNFFLDRYRPLATGALGHELDRVLGMVLDWEASATSPRLFLDAAALEAVRKRPRGRAEANFVRQAVHRLASERVEALNTGYAQTLGLGAYLMTGSLNHARRMQLVDRLRFLLGRLGYLDTMRAGGALAAFYDALIDSPLVATADRELFRSQLAYLGYHMADPATWSAERGYASGNLNMSVANAMQLGMLAAAIPDHPEARAWAEPALVMMEDLLATRVGPAGEWPESAAHYAHVSAVPMLAFAVAARNAGWADFVDDPRMKRFMLFLAKHYTPPDPRHTENDRKGRTGGTLPLGRGAAGEVFGLHGAMAAATAKSDPTYSRNLQWVWKRTGEPRRMPGDLWGGWEHVYLDESLPAEAPDWETEVFPQTGVLLRHGTGTPDEWWIYFANEQRYTVPAENGTLPMWFARGVPLSARFVASYPDREELLLSRVLLARGLGGHQERIAHFSHQTSLRELAAVSHLPRQAYVMGRYSIDEPWPKNNLGPPAPAAYANLRMLPEWPRVARAGEPGVRWQRQLLFVHGEAPNEPAYLVFRDSVSGGQPTMWQLWTVSQGIGTPAETADRRSWLGRAPGEQTQPVRALPAGDRYTAVGQFGVDLELFVAEPQQTPRHTLRFGLTHAYQTLQGYSEYEDLFHLQRPDDGSYVVVGYPRKPDEETPRFSSHAGGRVIEVSGRFGTDWAFLSDSTRSVSVPGGAGPTFEGTAASVQDRAPGPVLSLAAPGSVRFGDHALESGVPASLALRGAQGIALQLPRGHTGATLNLRAPGRWRLEAAAASAGARLEAGAGTLRVTAPAGLRDIRLEPEG